MITECNVMHIWLCFFPCFLLCWASIPTCFGRLWCPWFCDPIFQNETIVATPELVSCSPKTWRDFMGRQPDSCEAYGPAELRTASFSSVIDILDWGEANMHRQDRLSTASVLRQKTYRASFQADPSVEGRLMVCHDYGGGFWEDRYYQGFNRSEAFFQLYNWDLIDVFIYFTHDRLSVPPPGWMNLAHRHGTKVIHPIHIPDGAADVVRRKMKVLGTFLVEGGYGSDGFDDCIYLLRYPDIQEKLIDRLVAICSYFGFDGYLLNFESDLELRRDVEVLMERLLGFVEKLKARIQMTCPDAEVIWCPSLTTQIQGITWRHCYRYDSVTVKSETTELGSLNWQDSLTDGNRIFFDRSDGMLTNYFWKNTTLGEDYRNSTPRNLELYKGIDVFGRGTPAYSEGLGCLSAVDAIRSHGLSCGLFAPVYFHQHCPDNRTSADYSAEFWSELRDIWGHSNLPAQLPFLTHFSTGTGNSFFMNGRRVSPLPWFDLSKQDVLPVHPYHYVNHTGFNGGGCLQLRTQHNSSGHRFHYYPLFDVHFDLRQSPEILVSLVHDAVGSVGLTLQMSSSSDPIQPNETLVISSSLTPADIAQLQKDGLLSDTCHLLEANVQEVGVVDDIVLYPATSLQWHRLSAELTKPAGVITSIGIVGEVDQKPVHLGQLILAERQNQPSFIEFFTASNCKFTPGTAGKEQRLLVDCLLEWKTPSSQTAVFIQSIHSTINSNDSNKYPNKNHSSFLGSTASKSGYWIKNYPVDREAREIIVRLSCLDLSGRWTSLHDSPVCLIPTDGVQDACANALFSGRV